MLAQQPTFFGVEPSTMVLGLRGSPAEMGNREAGVSPSNRRVSGATCFTEPATTTDVATGGNEEDLVGDNLIVVPSSDGDPSLSSPSMLRHLQAKLCLPCFYFAQLLLFLATIYTLLTIDHNITQKVLQLTIQVAALTAISLFVFLDHRRGYCDGLLDYIFLFMGVLIVAGDWAASSKNGCSQEMWPLAILLRNIMACFQCRKSFITSFVVLVGIWISAKTIENYSSYGLYTIYDDERKHPSMSLSELISEICIKTLLWSLDSLLCKFIVEWLVAEATNSGTDVIKATELTKSLASYDLRSQSEVENITYEGLRQSLAVLFTRMKSIKPYLPQALFSEVCASSGRASVGPSVHNNVPESNSFHKQDWKSFRLTKKELSLTSRHQTFRREVYDTVSIASTFGCTKNSETESDVSCQTPKSVDSSTSIAANPLVMQDPRSYKRAKGVIVVLSLETDLDLRNMTSTKGTLDRFTEECCTSVLLHRGYIERMLPGVITCSWGIWTFTANAPQLAIAASLQTCMNMRSVGYSVTASVAMGDCFGGILGHADIIRSHFAAGPPVVLCEYISSLAAYHRLEVLCGPRVQNCVQYDFNCRPVDVLSGVAPYQKPQQIFEVRKAIEKAPTEEWMYTINARKSSLDTYQEGFDALFHGKHSEAKMLFTKHLSQLKDGETDLVCKRFISALEHQSNPNPKTPVSVQKSEASSPATPHRGLRHCADWEGCESKLSIRRSMQTLRMTPAVVESNTSLPIPYHRPVFPFRFVRFAGEDCEGQNNPPPDMVADKTDFSQATASGMNLPKLPPDTLRRTGLIPDLPSIPQREM
eukprot:TRINITY_DN13203_c0_g1_i2.p1 TRINITY_DN13203_c0_g1~~TRINITY_DN13203_c0_g1_i2.p1  ORF type:complete len:817 (+),score=105.35 TRINITY_DN13203_c0_g1_i2:1179-3629(+)